MFFHTKKTNLFEAYKQYAFNPCRQFKNIFLKKCANYDFENYEQDIEKIKNIYKSIKKSNTNNRIFVHSNGSSGDEQGYYIGPNGLELINSVESLQRNSNIEQLLRISTCYPEKKFFNKEVDENYIVVDFSSDGCIDFIMKFLYKNRQKTQIEVAPNVFMMMACHSGLLNELKNKSISIVTTGDDVYRKKEFKTIDRMMDWKTGGNFYECSFGEKHILPIWFEENGMSYNVLNLEKSHNSPIADLIKINSFSDCSCGKKKCDLEFVSHFKYKPKIREDYFDHKKIFEKIKGSYLNFQLIFKDKQVMLLVDEFNKRVEDEIFIEDYKITRNALEKMGFSVILEKKKYAYLGTRKRPLVWKDNGKIIMEQF